MVNYLEGMEKETNPADGETSFAERLKVTRAATGLSQQGMADRMLIPKRTIQKWEIGAATPPPYVQRFVLNELKSLAKNVGTPWLTLRSPK